MGVDLTTYRTRIGTFRHSVGVDVVTIVCCVNFTGALKTIGSVLFIGLLLIIAGIEQNPGPMEDVSSDWETESTSKRETLIQILWTHLSRTRTQIAIFILWATFIITVCYDAVTGLVCFVLLSFGIIIVQPETFYRSFSDFGKWTFLLWTNFQLFFCRINNKRPDKENGGEKTRDKANEHHDKSKAEDESRNNRQPLDENDIQLEVIIPAFVIETGDEIYKSKTDEQEGNLEEEESTIKVEQTSNEDIHKIKEDHQEKTRGKEPLFHLSHDEHLSPPHDIHNDQTAITTAEVVENSDDTIFDLKQDHQDTARGAEALVHSYPQFDESDYREGMVTGQKQTKLDNREIKQFQIREAQDIVGGETLAGNKDFESGRELGQSTRHQTSSDVVCDFELCEAAKMLPTTEMNKTVGMKGDNDGTSKLCPIHSGHSEVTTKVIDVLKLLGFDPSSKQEFTLKEVLTIDTAICNSDHQNSVRDLPLLFLKQILATNSACMDLRLYNLDLKDAELQTKSSKGSVKAMVKKRSNVQPISPLDLLLIVFQSCDPELKQLLFQKMFLCKIAVPFLYKDVFSQSIEMSVWPLHAIVIDNKTTTADKKQVLKETEVLEMPTKMVSFARLGRPLYSKSKLLNGLISNFRLDTFFNKECQSGLTSRCATNGYAEMFWLPTVGDKKSLFTEPITFINLRGDISKDFSVHQLNIISSLTDIFVLFLDLSTILKYGEYLTIFFRRFQYIVIIIASPFDPDNVDVVKSLELFELSVKSSADITLHMLCTNAGLEEKSPVDLCEEISELLAVCMTTENKSLTLQSRINNSPFNMMTDENNICMKAKREASNILEILTKVADQEDWTKKVTPVQFSFSRELGKLLKEKYSKKHPEGYEEIDSKIKDIKEQQLNVSEAVRKFATCLKDFSKEKDTLHFFLVWLKIFLDTKKQKTLTKLYQNHDKLWTSYNFLKNTNKLTVKDLRKHEKNIEESEGKIEEASFGIANFFRELAHIYDAMIDLEFAPSQICMPSYEEIADIFADLFLKGYSLELLDGNSLYIPNAWNKLVLNNVHTRINSKKVLSLSVLGLQSSGKSTLLNTMFGVQYTASSGRCTRGIHVQMIPVKLKYNPNDPNKFDYVLIIDTEGLRAPELKYSNYKRDNELAMIITGLGDITMINIMGENMAEIRDILQIIVHAFLRLNLANPTVDISKRCVFIHQNVNDVSASDKIKPGLQISVEELDKVTKESAESEGISSINSFNQVISFNVENDVWYLPNLWIGNPPMAQINSKYSELVVAINHELLRMSLKDSSKSFKTLQDIAENTKDLWIGVLAENFVFSFKNSIEKKAFVALENKLKDEFWDIENLVDKKVLELCNDKFKDCKSDESLRVARKEIKLDMQKFIATLTSSVSENIDKYFENNDYKELTIQWREKTLCQVHTFSDEVIMKKQHVIESLQNMKTYEIMTDTKNAKHEETLRRKSVELAKRLKTQNKNDKEINEEFEKIWNSFVEESFDTKEVEPENISLRQCFHDRLYDLFKRNHHVLFNVLKKHEMLAKEVSRVKLSGSFHATGINNDDLSLKTVLDSMVTKVPLVQNFSAAFKCAREACEIALSAADEKISKIRQCDSEVNDSDIRMFLHQVMMVLHDSLNVSTDQFTAKSTFFVKALVHIGNVACRTFEKHNEEFTSKYGIKAKLQKYKVKCRERFQSHLNDRGKEDTAAIIFRHEIEKYVSDNVKYYMSYNAKQSLRPLLPETKYHLILKLLENLVERKDFYRFSTYIKSPETFAESWITYQSQRLLFTDNPLFYQITVREINSHITELTNVIEESFSQLAEMPSIDDWVNYLQTNLKVCKFPKSSFLEVQKEFGKKCVDSEHFKNSLLKQICVAKDNLHGEFCSITEETVKWRTTNPYDDLLNKIWGCRAKCVFCGEPCKNTTSGHAGKHVSLQHRPSGVHGVRNSVTQEIWLRNCNYDAATNVNCLCNMFKYACNNGEGPCSEGKHPFRNYEIYFSDWEIESCDNMNESSQFWLWFIGKYKQQLGEFYHIDVSNVPSSWKKIKKKKALESLRNLYI